MELSTVKTEFCPRSHRLFMMQGGNIDIKCMKRRRRDSSVVLLQGNEKQEQPRGGQSTATTTTVKRSSRFRGVSRHRWTGRYEAHLWDKGTWNPTQKKKGKQGAYADEEAAARAYDLAALKYWGISTFINFPQYLTPLSHSNGAKSSSSPTALGLLLKSSVFRDLCSSNGNRIPNLQSPEEKALPVLYQRTGRTLWNECFERI